MAVFDETELRPIPAPLEYVLCLHEGQRVRIYHSDVPDRGVTVTADRSRTTGLTESNVFEVQFGDGYINPASIRYNHLKEGAD